jgi:hypothetical protein
MGTAPMRKPAPSLFGGLISRQRSPWITAGIALLLVLAPVGAAALDGMLDQFFRHDLWRLSWLPPAVILYILIVSPIMARMEAGVIEAFRPLVQMDDEDFKQLVSRATRIEPIGEVLTFVLGAAFGLWVGRLWFSGTDLDWMALYVPLSACLMFGLLAWTIYVLMASTRLTAALHRPPLRIDIFDTTPFEPIGRQSLISALVFVGGIVLGMIFGVGQGSILAWQTWLMIFVLALVPVFVFFLNMRPTHRVLAAEKGRELEIVGRNIRQACRTLVERVDADEITGTLGAEINALVTYEERLQAARTWPYDTAMARTLVFSVVIPGAASLARAVFELAFW